MGAKPKNLMRPLQLIRGEHTMDLNQFTPEIRRALKDLDKHRSKALKAQLQAETVGDAEKLAMYVEGILDSMRIVAGDK